jgi:hypothetical protein
MAGLAARLSLGSIWAVQTRPAASPAASPDTSPDTGTLFIGSLPWKRRAAALQHALPQSEDRLIAVMFAPQPEQASLAARDLAAALPAARRFAMPPRG